MQRSAHSGKSEKLANTIFRFVATNHILGFFKTPLHFQFVVCENLLHLFDFLLLAMLGGGAFRHFLFLAVYVLEWGPMGYGWYEMEGGCCSFWLSYSQADWVLSERAMLICVFCPHLLESTTQKVVPGSLGKSQREGQQGEVKELGPP